MAGMPGGITITVSRVVLRYLGVVSGTQDRVVAAFVFQDHHDRWFTAAVCVTFAFGHSNFRRATEYSGFTIFVLYESVGDVNRLHGHRYGWWGETVSFRRVAELRVFGVDPEHLGDVHLINDDL
ncbi:hypothetical protein ACP70R_047042 [Stipagrostis hirtigluma subsp. patula]